MNRISTTPGLFPLPDWAKEDLIALKGKQKEDLIGGDEGPEIDDVYERARAEVIRAQIDRGIDRVVEGQLRWDDMLCHPLAVHPAVETGGLRRYYDNNNFYRESIVTEALGPIGDVGAELDAATAHLGDADLQAVLPGPYSLSELATDEHYGDAAAFVRGLAAFLAGELSMFPESESLFLLEPSLGTESPDHPRAVLEALGTVAEAASEAGISETVVHTYWGIPTAEMYSGLLDIEDIGVGLDLVTARAAALELIEEFGVPDGVALGLVDGQNTRLETPAELDETISTCLEVASGAERVYVTTNTELFYLPVNRALEKLEILGRATDPAEVPS